MGATARTNGPIVRRRLVCCAASAVVVGSVLPVRAQSSRMPRVVWISAGGSPDVERSYERGMQAKWKELGWIHGRNIHYDIRRFRGDQTLLAKQAADIAVGKYDVILAGDLYVVGALLKAGVKGPIVVQVGSNTVEYGLAKSLARPGGQITGLEWAITGEVWEKIPEFTKQILPGMTKWGLVFDPNYTGAALALPAAEQAVNRLGMNLLRVDAGNPEEIDPAFEKLAAQGAHWVHAWCSPFHYVQMDAINAAATRHKLPISWPVRAAVEAGGVLSYGADIEDMYIQAIGHANKILRGAKPGDLPIELPKVYELVINVKSAKSFGLTVPKSLLVRADHVIT